MKLKILTLIIVVVCLSLTACGAQVASSNYNPTAQLTATASEPIHNIPKIAEVLDQLAEKNVSMIQMQGWWRRINTVVEQSGDLYSSNYESWSYLPQDPSQCLVRMDIIKDPNSGETDLWQLQTEEGYMGDLVSLRQGTSEVMKVDPSLCRSTAAATEAGYLARSLLGEANGKDSRKAAEWAKAWYEEQEGKPVFVVHVGFKTPFDKLTTQTEIYSFDLQSGMALDHYLSMVYDDGREMGSFDTQSRYELWEKLPEDIAAQLDQASTELKTYIGKSIRNPSADSSPEPTIQSIDLDSMMKPYTKENPLTDETQAVDMVQEIMRRRAHTIEKPGWLLQKSHWLGGKDYTNEQYILVHITGANGECQEQMVYFYKEGKLSPWIVRLANGLSGNLYALEKSQGNERSDIKENTLCSLYNGESIFFYGDFLFVDETANLKKFIQDVQNGLIEGNFRIWLDGLNERPVLVLEFQTENDSADGLIMDPSTQELVHFTQKSDLRYFDLETGMLVWLVDRYTLENGSVDDGGGGLEYTWQYFSKLPDELAAAYTQAAEELTTYAQETEN